MATSGRSVANSCVIYVIGLSRPLDEPDPDTHFISFLVYSTDDATDRRIHRATHILGFDVLLAPQGIRASSGGRLHIEVSSTNAEVCPADHRENITSTAGFQRVFQFCVSRPLTPTAEAAMRFVVSCDERQSNDFIFRWVAAIPRVNYNINVNGERAVGICNNIVPTIEASNLLIRRPPTVLDMPSPRDENEPATPTGRSPNNGALDTDDAESSTTDYTSGSEEQMESLTLDFPPDPWDGNAPETTEVTPDTLDDMVSQNPGISNNIAQTIEACSRACNLSWQSPTVLDSSTPVDETDNQQSQSRSEVCCDALVSGLESSASCVRSPRSWRHIFLLSVVLVDLASSFSILAVVGLSCFLGTARMNMHEYRNTNSNWFKLVAINAALFSTSTAQICLILVVYLKWWRHLGVNSSLFRQRFVSIDN